MHFRLSANMPEHSITKNADPLEDLDVIIEDSDRDTVFQKILDSLQRIEGVLQENRQEKRHEKYGEGRDITGKPVNMQDLIKQAHSDRRESRLKAWTRAGANELASGSESAMKYGKGHKICGHKSSIDDISGCRELLGFLADLPLDPSGLLDIVVSKAQLEGESLEIAGRELAKCDSFFIDISASNNSNGEKNWPTRFYIIDVVLGLENLPPLKNISKPTLISRIYIIADS